MWSSTFTQFLNYQYFADYSSITKASKNNFAVFKYSYPGLKNGIEVGKFRPKNEHI